MPVEDFRYESWELDAMIEALEPLNPFLYNRYFKARTVMSDAPTIEWDIVEGGQRIAPFVSPFVSGKPIKSRGHMTASFKPAYIKPTKTLYPEMGFVRLPGEKYGGTLTPRQRIDRLMAQQLKLHDDMLENRMNWIASKILYAGEVTISGDEYQSVTVGFGSHADLRPAALSAGARWSQTTAVPLDDIEAMALDIRTISYGAVATEVIMDGTAWGYFRERMKDNKMFDSTLNINDSGRTSIAAGPRNDIGGELVGRLAGRFDVWVYDGMYEDDEGAQQPFMPVYTAEVIAASAMQGTQYFGAIFDMAAGLTAQRIYHKTKEEWDPSGVTLLSQSAPMLAPRRRNAAGRLIVHQ